MFKAIIIAVALTLSTAHAALFRTIKLTKKNSYTLSGSINQDSIKKAILAIADLDHSRASKGEPIYLVLKSPGGSVMAGERLIQFAKHIPNLHTISIYAASMAHAIVQALPGTRFATEHNIMMAHRARGSFQGQFETGEVESQLKLFKKVVRTMELRNSSRIGISLEEYKKRIVNEWWAHGLYSKQQNIVDEIIDIQCSKALVDTTTTRTVRSIFGSQVVKESACPLVD